MSRKRAIEAAAQQAIGDHKLPAPEALRVWIAAGTAFDSGRIAGLREAARIALVWWGAETVADIIREHARKLAKKARAK